MENLYGAWIDRQGNFIPVEEECHAEKAMEILNAKHDTNLYSFYRVMYRLGYIRMMYKKFPNEYEVEFWDNLQPTKNQIDFIYFFKGHENDKNNNRTYLSSL